MTDLTNDLYPKDLPAIAPGDVVGNDLLVLFDVSALKLKKLAASDLGAVGAFGVGTAASVATALQKDGSVTPTANLPMGGFALIGSKVSITAISGSQTVTTSFADEYLTSDSSGVTWTLPANGVVGQQFVVWQGAAGQITFAAASGATVGFSAGSHTKTARQYAGVTVRCVANSGGSAAVWIVSGATA
jgi:hypothetical protein